jgi:hypothetical protein
MHVSCSSKAHFLDGFRDKRPAAEVLLTGLLQRPALFYAFPLAEDVIVHILHPLILLEYSVVEKAAFWKFSRGWQNLQRDP